MEITDLRLPEATKPVEETQGQPLPTGTKPVEGAGKGAVRGDLEDNRLIFPKVGHRALEDKNPWTSK